jgi:uncharacterized membrane protein
MSEKENIFKLKQEIQALLKAKPELIPLQEKIDELMRNAGNQNNRLVIIKNMMFDSLKRMEDALREFPIVAQEFISRCPKE